MKILKQLSIVALILCASYSLYAMRRGGIAFTPELGQQLVRDAQKTNDIAAIERIKDQLKRSGPAAKRFLTNVESILAEKQAAQIEARATAAETRALAAESFLAANLTVGERAAFDALFQPILQGLNQEDSKTVTDNLNSAMFTIADARQCIALNATDPEAAKAFLLSKLLPPKTKVTTEGQGGEPTAEQRAAIAALNQNFEQYSGAAQAFAQLPTQTQLQLATILGKAPQDADMQQAATALGNGTIEAFIQSKPQAPQFPTAPTGTPPPAAPAAPQGQQGTGNVPPPPQQPQAGAAKTPADVGLVEIPWGKEFKAAGKTMMAKAEGGTTPTEIYNLMVALGNDLEKQRATIADGNSTNQAVQAAYLQAGEDSYNLFYYAERALTMIENNNQEPAKKSDIMTLLLKYFPGHNGLARDQSDPNNKAKATPVPFTNQAKAADMVNMQLGISLYKKA